VTDQSPKFDLQGEKLMDTTIETTLTGKNDRFLVCENLCRNFGALKAVNNVSFEVKEGQIFSIIGPNGAGKTTLFNVITGIYPASGGTVTFEGKDLKGLAPHLVTRLGLARTYQIVRLFDKMSVLENTMVGFYSRIYAGIFDILLNTKRAKQERAEVYDRSKELLDRIGMSKYIDYDAANLPLGLRKRLQIARALATQPKVLLLDEPTGGMNPTEKTEIMALIKQLQRDGLTILLVEHDMNVIMNVSDQIVVLDYGEKIAEGTAAQIQNNDTVIEAYLGRGVNK
jgi:branched-chain amino acid transport system ATP-binding protein